MASVQEARAGAFSLTGSMSANRVGHTATTLSDGTVLMIGGRDGGAGPALNTAEIYDPEDGTFTSTGSMVQGRTGHSATRLSDGRVLVAGGNHYPGSWADGLGTAEIYNPATGKFSPTGSMVSITGPNPGVLLPSGKVLVVSGYRAELYDPATGTFADAGSTGARLVYPTATALQSGKVLFAGGGDGFQASNAAVTYDPVTSSFTATGLMNDIRSAHTASLVAGGEVLVAGGIDGGTFSVKQSAEIYSPGSGQFRSAGEMNSVRWYHTASTLGNGKVLLAGGGVATFGQIQSAETYDPESGQFELVGEMWFGRASHTATPLPDGRVLMAGGGSATAEVYDPDAEDTPHRLQVSVNGTGQGVVTSNPEGIHCGETCETDFTGIVTLTAEAFDGSYFAGWSGACHGTGTCQVTMTEAREVEAEFTEYPKFSLTAEVTGDGLGEITSYPSGIRCGQRYENELHTDCETEIGGTVSLYADPAAGFGFAGWSGACDGQDRWCTLTVDEAMHVEARFVELPKYTLSVSKSGPVGGTVTSFRGDIVCGDVCETQIGGEVTLYVEPDLGSRFVGWSGACDGTSRWCYLSVDQARHAVAEFEPGSTHKLTVSLTGDGSGEVSGGTSLECRGNPDGCEEEFNEGDNVSLLATPDAGSRFVGWTGCDSEWQQYCTVTMDRARTVSAEFERAEKHTLSVSKSGDGTGEVWGYGDEDSWIGCGDRCETEAGGTFWLNASPDPGSRFVGWTGACEGSDSWCEVTMNEAKHVNAEFRIAEKFKLTVTRSGEGAGRVYTTYTEYIWCGDVCEAQVGGTVELYASPDSGSGFVKWSGACEGAERWCTVTMDEAKQVDAEFREMPTHTLTVSKTGHGTGWVRSWPAGIQCGDPRWEGDTGSECEKGFAGTVELQADARPGSKFVGWSGACEGTSTWCDVTMDEAKQVTAEFVLLPAHNLKVTKVGTGQGAVSSTGTDLSCGDVCETEIGGPVELEAWPSDGSRFVGWSGACSGTSWYCWVDVDEAKEVVAEFELLPRHPLTINKDGDGEGTVRSYELEFECGEVCEIEASGVVWLEAEPGPGSVFEGWSDACEAWDEWCRVQMDEAKSVTATFRKGAPRTITVDKFGNGQGRVVSAPAGIDCGETCEAEMRGRVVLTAEPASGSTFEGWSGACSGVIRCVLEEGDANVKAAFMAPEPPPNTSPPAPTVVVPPAPGGGKVHVDRQVNQDSGLVFFTVPWGTVNSFSEGCMPLQLDVPLNAGAGAISNVTVLLAADSYPATEHSPGQWRAEIPCVKAGKLWVSYTLTEEGQEHRYTIPIGGIELIDPQGVVYDRDEFEEAKADGKSDEEARAAAAISGATVRLQRLVEGEFVNVPSGDPGISPNVNPQITGEDGLYQWDVSEGTYRVVVAAPGYPTVSSDSVDIPPPVLDLHIPMVKPQPARHNLQVERSGSGAGVVTSDPSGIECGPACESEFVEGAEITLTATPGDGSTFTGWSGACSGTAVTCVVTMTEARSVSAGFNLVPPSRTLNVVKDGSGSGAVVSDPAGPTHVDGTEVTLTATPDSGSTFASWTGCDQVDDNVCVVTMGSNRTVTATFGLVPAPPKRALSVARTGDGSGTVSSSPTGIDCGSSCQADFAHGTEVTLTASPGDGSTFTGWSGACSGTAVTCVVTMTEARSVGAGFGREQGPGPGEPVLAPLKVTPRSKTLKRGKRATVKVGVGNTGTASAEGVKVCASGPKKLVSVSRCLKLSPLAAGQSKTAKFKVTVKKRARRGARAKVTFTATAPGLPKKTGKISIRVR